MVSLRSSEFALPGVRAVPDTSPGPRPPGWLDAFTVGTVPVWPASAFSSRSVPVDIFLSSYEVNSALNITSDAELSYFLVIEESSCYVACRMAGWEVTGLFYKKYIY